MEKLSQMLTAEQLKDLKKRFIKDPKQCPFPVYDDAMLRLINQIGSGKFYKKYYLEMGKHHRWCITFDNGKVASIDREPCYFDTHA